MAQSRSRGYCFTINNYSEEDIAICNNVICKYLTYGKEVGESGTPHLQGVIYFDNAKTLAAVKRCFHPTAHLENMRGTLAQAIEYCHKEDQTPYERGTRPMTQAEKGEAGKQSIEERWALAKEGKFEELPPEMIKHYEYIHRKYVEVEDRNELDNVWICGPSGCGKSQLVRNNYPLFYSKGMNKWWDGYNHEPVVLLDDFDPKHGEYLDYFLKIWADHYAFNAEVKGGMLRIRPKTVVVTSQYNIEACFKDPEAVAAIKRRFKIKRWSTLFNDFVDVESVPVVDRPLMY